MSVQYYRNIKCTRGGGSSGKNQKYTMEYFYKMNKKGQSDLIKDYELMNKSYD